MSDVTQEDRIAAWPFAPEYYRSNSNPRVKQCWMDGQYDKYVSIISAFASHRQATASSLAAENERLRQALKPFAEHADFYESCEAHPNGCPDGAQAGEIIDITVGDFRRARAAYKENDGG